MTDGKDTAAKTKPLISKENAQNRPGTIQRGQVLGVSAFREQIGNSAAKRRCPLCPVCRNTSRENGFAGSRCCLIDFTHSYVLWRFFKKYLKTT